MINIINVRGITLLTISLFFFGCVVVGVGAFSIDDVVEYPYSDGGQQLAGEEATDIGQVVKDNSVDDEQGVVQQIMQAFGIDYTNETDQTATFYIKELINWLLAIIGLVALISMLWGFYKMLLATDSEEGYTSAKKIVLNAALAIVIIGLSRFLVSWFFAIYQATLSTTGG